MSFGSRMKKRREELGLKQSELGKKLGVTGSAVGNYENGVSSPKAEILYRIFDVLNCDANYLFQDEMHELQNDSYTISERNMIKRYRVLDEYGARLVDSVLDIEHERCVAELTASSRNKRDRLIPLSLLPASAGTGEQLDYNEWDELEIPDRPEYKAADFAVKVSGDSMQPTFCDGDIVLIHEQDAVNIGDIGLFSVGGCGYIKEQGKDRLISHNRQYDDIVPDIDDLPRCFGKVIGKLEQSEY